MTHTTQSNGKPFEKPCINGTKPVNPETNCSCKKNGKFLSKAEYDMS